MICKGLKCITKNLTFTVTYILLFSRTTAQNQDKHFAFILFLFFLKRVLLFIIPEIYTSKIDILFRTIVCGNTILCY